MTLPDVLRELQGLLPERIELGKPFPKYVMVRVLTGEFWHTVFELTLTGSVPVFRCAEAALEYALREECEARGWLWAVGRSEPEWRGALLNAAQVHGASVTAHGTDYYGRADTPAEALAAALLVALRAEPVALLTAGQVAP